MGRHWMGFVVGVAGVLLLVGCAGGQRASEVATPAPTATVVAPPAEGTPLPTATTPLPSTEAAPPRKGSPTALPAATPESGLTWEEALKTNPPPPMNLTAQLVGGAIRLEWDAPPPVEVPHSYSDVISHYKVYRRTERGAIELLASPTQTRFEDKTAQPGEVYYYTVTAVHLGDIEGMRPNEVVVAWWPLATPTPETGTR